MSFSQTKTKRFVAGLLGSAMALSLVFVGGAAPVQAQTSAELQAQINSLLATIAALQAQLGASSGTAGATTGGYTFTRNLKQGDTGADVMNLQKVLNMSADTRVSASGAGSPGNETSTFGPATKAAVVKFQNKYAAEILTPVGLTAGTGFVGASTRAKLNATGAVSTPAPTTGTGTTPTTGTPAVGTGLSVAAPVQPGPQLAPQSAARVPFTKVALTAGADGDVTVNSLTVERTGQAADAVFSGIVLLDENGIQIGIAKTLNSNHQVLVGEPFTVKAGTTRVVTVAGNLAADNSTRAGQVATLTVQAVNTSAVVSGALPITGAAHTINSSLTLGSATTAVSSFDPNVANTKEIGTTGFKFSGIRVTAGSSEDIRLWSIRWNQSGSASKTDLDNVKVIVDGTSYDTTISSDGKYYTASFGSGIVIGKGNNKDVYIQGDIIGSGSANRTVQFDIYKTTDLYLSGETYGYGITPSAGSTGSSSTASEFTTTTPWFDGSKLTINAGSVTTVSKASSVAAQNIAVNVPNQILGGFETDIKGEPISVQQIVITVASTSGSGTGHLTNVTIVDSNGAVVAGPVDTSGAGTSLTFTDTITFPIGKKTYTLKGKVASTIGNGTVYTLSTTPSTQWTNVTGQTTGNTISLSTLSSSVSLNPVTVKAASLNISVSSSPSAQTIVGGGSTERVFANYQLDGSQSGEDVRFSSIPLNYTVTTGSASDLNNCKLYDGTAALTTGSNVVTSPTAGSNTFTLDTAYTVPKGTVKTITLKCTVSSSSGAYSWGIAAAPSITVTGITSSNDVTENVTSSNGQTQTVGTGSLAVSEDSSSPSYTIAAAGATGVTMGVLKFRATNEAINLERVALKLTNTASSSSSDLVRVTLWDGATQVGEAVFTGAATQATSTIGVCTGCGTVTLPKDQDKAITVKADLANIGTGQSGTSGHLIAIDYDNTAGTRGTGSDSGTAITASGSTSIDGVRVFKSYPTLAKLSVPTQTLDNGQKSLLRFKITADSRGSVGIAKLTLRIATTTAVVASPNIYVYTDAGFSQVASGLRSDGAMLNADKSLAAQWVSASTDLEFWAESGSASTTIQVPAGQARYFDVIGTLSGAATGASVSTQLQGDAAYPMLRSLFMAAAGDVGSTTAYSTNNDDFVWSPNSTTTAGLATEYDWTNGYGIVGLPALNMSAEVLSK